MLDMSGHVGPRLAWLRFSQCANCDWVIPSDYSPALYFSKLCLHLGIQLRTSPRQQTQQYFRGQTFIEANDCRILLQLKLSAAERCQFTDVSGCLSEYAALKRKLRCYQCYGPSTVKGEMALPCPLFSKYSGTQMSIVKGSWEAISELRMTFYLVQLTMMKGGRSCNNT